MGVPVEQLRAAVAAARVAEVGDGAAWSGDEWERLWALLTKREQWVVYLHVFVELTHTEVGERLGVGRGAVDAAWRRALGRIRDALPAPPCR